MKKEHSEEKEEKKNFYKDLEKLFEKKPSELAQMLNDLANVLDFRNKKGDNIIKPALKAITKRNYTIYAILIHFLYGVDLKAFDIGEDLKNKLEKLKNPEIQTLSLNKFSDSETNQEFVKEYFDKSQYFLSKIDNNLSVYDYLARFEINSDLSIEKSYEKQHEKIFNLIEDILKKSLEKKKVFKYERYLALPERMIDYDNKFTQEELTYRIIKNLTLPLFKHICNCLKLNPDFEKKDFLSQNIKYYGFYMLDYTPRCYHFAYTKNLNEEEFLLSEYYRFNKFGFCKHDLLFIEESHGEMKKLSKLYNRAFNKMLFHDGKKLTLNIMKEVLQKEYDSYCNKQQLKQKYISLTQMEKKAEYLFGL